jgi:hypothetical protein
MTASSLPMHHGSIIANLAGPHGAHSFVFVIPQRYRDGTDHTIKIYGINIGPGGNPLLASRNFRLY